MMSSLTIVATSLFSFFQNAPPAEARPPAFEVTKIMRAIRDFRRLKEDLVLGSPDALPQLAERAPRISGDLRNEEMSAWKENGNVFALLSYVLVGGDASVLRSVLIRKGIDSEHYGLATWVLAFGEGRVAGAKIDTSKFDVAKYPLEFATAFRLARATVQAIDNPKSALGELEFVQLDAPGSQLEDAALRHEALVLARIGDVSRAMGTAGRYFRRFPNSAFASDFIVRLSREIVTNPASDDANSIAFTALGDSTVSGNLAIRALQTIGLDAIASGRLKLAAVVGAHLLEHSTPASAEHRAGRLYQLLALAPSANAKHALAGLRNLPKGDFTRVEQGLIAVAIDVAQQIAAPGAPGTEVQSGSEQESTPTGGNSKKPVSAFDPSSNLVGPDETDRQAALLPSLLKRAGSSLKAADDAMKKK